MLTTDRFFNGLLQQHHFGPREIDFTDSEALDDLFVSLVDHGVIVPVSSLSAPRRDRPTSSTLLVRRPWKE